MSGKPPPLFDTVAFDIMRPGRYLKVHPYEVTDPDTGITAHVNPCAGNPYSTGRLARRDHPRGAAAVTMSYVASTGAVALFEALLRNAKILPERMVYFEPTKLANMCLSVLTLSRPVEVFPADLPDRRMVVTDPVKDDLWRGLISTAHHSATWGAAVNLASQLRAAGKDLGGITWNSVQCPQGGAVYLLYDPPNGHNLWTPAGTTRLATESGKATIKRELGAYGYTWVDSGLVDHQTPPRGAL